MEGQTLKIPVMKKTLHSTLYGEKHGYSSVKIISLWGKEIHK